MGFALPTRGNYWVVTCKMCALLHSALRFEDHKASVRATSRLSRYVLNGQI